MYKEITNLKVVTQVLAWCYHVRATKICSVSVGQAEHHVSESNPFYAKPYIHFV